MNVRPFLKNLEARIVSFCDEYFNSTTFKISLFLWSIVPIDIVFDISIYFYLIPILLFSIVIPSTYCKIEGPFHIQFPLIIPIDETTSNQKTDLESEGVIRLDNKKKKMEVYVEFHKELESFSLQFDSPEFIAFTIGDIPGENLNFDPDEKILSAKKDVPDGLQLVLKFRLKEDTSVRKDKLTITDTIAHSTVKEVPIHITSS